MSKHFHHFENALGSVIFHCRFPVTKRVEEEKYAGTTSNIIATPQKLRWTISKW
jgi:hypothetical protein